MVLQLLGTSCWYRDNCITKLWAHCSYFLYLCMVFCQHCFHSEQHRFPALRKFQTDWFESSTQSSLVIQNCCSVDYICILSPLLHNCFVSFFKSYLNIFHPWCLIRFTYILGTNVSQLQTSFTTIDFVHLAFLFIPYKIHSPCNVSGMFGILAILSHAHSRFTIQDNQRSSLWNYFWILV